MPIPPQPLQATVAPAIVVSIVTSGAVGSLTPTLTIVTNGAAVTVTYV